MEKENIKPIYDDRVNEILQGLAQNISREQLALTFGHKNYKTLDIYMRRRNFTWDSNKQTYVPKLVENKQLKERVMPTTKAGIVIEMMKQADFNIEEVCQKAGFTDHRDLAEYMTAKGYQWSPTESNYVKKVGLVSEDREQGEMQKGTITNLNSNQEVHLPSSQSPVDIMTKVERFLPLFELLEANKEKIMEIITGNNTIDTLPRYIVPGRPSGKTIQMSEALQDVAVTFCNERNIKQRELFEMALIEFFKKYGYDYEIANLMQAY
jgi:hypothetical protein